MKWSVLKQFESTFGAVWIDFRSKQNERDSELMGRFLQDDCCGCQIADNHSNIKKEINYIWREPCMADKEKIFFILKAMGDSAFTCMVQLVYELSGIYYTYDSARCDRAVAL